jgi:hypothetical protein
MMTTILRSLKSAADRPGVSVKTLGARIDAEQPEKAAG